MADRPPPPARASWRRARRLVALSAGVLSISALAALLTAWPSARSSRAAAAGEPARVRIAAALADEIARGLLPFDVVLSAAIGGPPDGGAPPPPTPMMVTELRYCGATEKGNGRLRAVLRSGGMAGRGTPVLGGSDEACRLGLADLAKQLANRIGRDDGLAVADMEASWRPWEVRLTLLRVMGPGASKPGGPRPLVVLENRRDLLTFSTTGLRLLPDAGEPITLHLGPSFASDGIDLVVALGEHAAGPPAARPLSGSGQIPGLAGTLNVAADIPHAFANQVLRQLTAASPLAVPVDREVIDVQNISLTGAVGNVTVAGLATARSLREPVRLTVHAGGGEEVRVLSVRAEAQLESCAGLGTVAAIGCNTRNVGRSAAAGAIGTALNQKYQGQVVRDLIGTQILRLDAGNRRWVLQGGLAQISAGGRGLAMAGRFALSGVNH